MRTGFPASIEQVSAWLFRVARNRIIDRFRKKKEVAVSPVAEPFASDAGNDDGEYRLDLALPATDAGPEAAYARSVLLTALAAGSGATPGQPVGRSLWPMNSKAAASRTWRRRAG